MSERVALVTGASRGIGRAIALHLTTKGYRVVGTATTEDGALSLSGALPDGKGMVLDVTDSQSVLDGIKRVTDELGSPAILVNNAGIIRDNLLMRMKDEEWDSIIDTDLNSIYRLSKHCLRGMMKARWGRIVNIASVVALTGNPGQTNYAAAKAGMIGFTKALAREVGSRNITVNAVAPGFIDTDMTRALPAEQQQALLNSIPLNRFGTVEEVAHAVAFLCSEQAGYITGETIHVNGGMFMP